MSLEKLAISADAYFVCLAHVLSTESSEVMGILLGELDADKTCHVISAKILVRLDKQKDRVEISPQQLLSAAREAEALSAELARPVRVVGWYHSHPHITVWPSAVDLGTQDAFQVMDAAFAGLIFAVYPEKQSGQLRAACFQSVRDAEGRLRRRDLPLRLTPTPTIAAHCLRALAQLPEVLREEEVRSYDLVQDATAGDVLTEMHNQAVLVRNTAQQLGLLTLPLVRWMEDRLKHNQRRLRLLLARKQQLTALLVKREPPSDRSSPASQAASMEPRTGNAGTEASAGSGGGESSPVLERKSQLRRPRQPVAGPSRARGGSRVGEVTIKQEEDSCDSTDTVLRGDTGSADSADGAEVAGRGDGVLQTGVSRPRADGVKRKLDLGVSEQAGSGRQKVRRASQDSDDASATQVGVKRPSASKATDGVKPGPARLPAITETEKVSAITVADLRRVKKERTSSVEPADRRRRVKQVQGGSDDASATAAAAVVDPVRETARRRQLPSDKAVPPTGTRSRRGTQLVTVKRERRSPERD